MNYGHRLEFGALLTPDGQYDRRPVTLARLSEELGYDLVVVGDHPDGPEPGTLLAWIGAVTSRVRLAAVHDLALRAPAMLARATASLDLLTGGRVELGLGADPMVVEERDGPRWTPDDAAAALEEAREVVGALWGTSRARYSGRHYRLAGAEPSTPAHELSIWLRAADPATLGLVGAKADGWFAPPDLTGLQAGNRLIDDAARSAGRDPREIRRLVTVSGRFTDGHRGFCEGPPDGWVGDLLPLVVEHGAGTVLLASDDPATLTRFARDVAPALRGAADRALPHGSAGFRIRKAAVLAQRRKGIDYDGAPASLAEVVEPGDLTYRRLRSGYLRGGSPGVILRAADHAQVTDALRFARAHPELPLSIRSAGHGISGRSTNDGGIVVDVSLINRIEVLDERTRRVRIGPGARWMEVAAALEPHGWALSSGDYGGVGVGGLATAGGIGFLAREHGLTIDHVRAVELVLADGSPVRAGDTENPDLFWAMRGAGANFGIATAFEFEADEVGPVGFGQLVLDASDTAGFLRRWGDVVEGSPRDLTSFLIMSRARRGQPALAYVMSMVDSAEPQTVIDRLQPVADIAPLYSQQVQIMPYAAVMANASEAEHNARGEPISRSGLLDHITPEFAAAAAEVIGSGGVHWFQLRSVGGAVADVDPDATAYAHRAASFSVVAMGSREPLVDALWDRLRPHFRGLYLSFESSLRPDRIADAFPPRTLARLRDLKAKYDPDNVFRDNFGLTPERSVS